MFGSEMMELAIGMIFIFLLLSLICSAIREIIEARMKMRAVDLEKGIRELLNDPNGTGLTQQLYNHPLIFGLFKGDYTPAAITKGHYPRGSTLPSYIPARSFALALMDTVMPAKLATPAAAATPSGAAGATPSPLAAAPRGLQPLRDAIHTIGNPKVEQALMTLVDAAGDDVSKARENIEMWYDSVMNRVTGWYQRRTQVILLFLGLAISIAVNADTVTIANSLMQDKALRGSLVAAAQEYAKTQSQSATVSPEARVKKNLEEIQKFGLPVGWNRDDPRTVPTSTGGWATKALGWLLTAIAISLGAPFWFDLLNKFMAARSSRKPS